MLIDRLHEGKEKRNEREYTGQVTDSVVSNFSLALIVAENALYQVYFSSFSVMGKAPL